MSPPNSHPHCGDYRETAWCLLLPFFLLHVNSDLSLSHKHFQRHCYGIQTNYVIMACYNAITALDPSDCLFKKQWEWEEVVRFHTPGWETWAGTVTVDWQPLPGRGTVNDQSALSLTRPSHPYQPIRASEGRDMDALLCIQRGTTERSTEVGGGWGKVTQERRNSWCCWCTDGRRGELYFAINRIVENLWPQTAPDQLSVESFWSGLWAFQSWIYPTAAAKCLGRFGRYAATNAGVFSTTPAPGPNFFNFLMDPLGNTPETPRFELLLKFFKQFC